MGWIVSSQTRILLLLLNPFLMLSPLAAVQQITNPRIVEHPEDLYTGRNEPATLNCKAEGDPPPIITWYRNGELVITANENPLSHRMLLPSGQLFFLRVIHSKNSRSDAGSYYCNATNPLTGVSSISRNASLQIAMIRDEFREQPQNTEKAVGDDVILQCRPPRGDPEPKVEWKKDEKALVTNSRIYVQDDGSLYMRDLEKDDAGMYSCVAHNIGGRRESKPARLSILEKPKITEAPSDVVVSEHGDVLFQCRATGDPEPITIWKKQKGLIPGPRSKILENRNLRLKKVKVQDEGIYICRVENSVGWQEAEARLSVHVQPSFVTVPQSKSVGLGRRVSFECEATGNPVPAVFWKREDSPMLMFPDHSYGHFSVKEDGMLVIDQVQKEDAGMFICQAQSVAGSAVVKAELTVKEMDSRPPPIIRHGLQNQTLPINSLATLQCTVSGDPTPTVRWYKNHRILNLTDRRFTVQDSGTLQIGELHQMDTGWYTCKAISETGETSWSGALIVEAPTNPSIIFRRTPEPSTYPGPPSKPQVIDIKENSVKLSWRPNPNHGASQVASYMVEYFSHETGEGWMVASNAITETAFVVRGLRPDTSYRFLVRAQNSHGTSLPSQVTGIIKTRGEFLGNSGSMEHASDVVSSKLSTQIVHLAQPDAITATTIHLRWDVRRSQRYIEGFHIKYCAVQNEDDDAERGPDLPPAVFAIQTIPNADSRVHILQGLEENTLYMIFLQPYYQLTEGAASNTIYAHTLEDVPAAPPANFQAVISDNDTLHLSWQPPAKRNQNGIITGYKIYLSANDSQFYQDIWTNSSIFELTIRNLPRDIAYHVQIAAHTKVGEGVRSEAFVIGQSVLELSPEGIEQQPWFLAAVIVCAGGALWLLICVLIVCLYKHHNKQHAKYTSGHKKQIDLVTEHTMSSKEDKTSHGKENIYENISSIGANSMTKSIYDGSSLTSQPTADLKGGMLDMSLARRPLPGELDPFCQAYIIKPKPPLAGGTGSSTLETKTVDSDSLKAITMNNCYNTFIQNSSPLYPSLRRYPFHTVNPPLPPEGIYQHHHNQSHFFSGSSGVQIPNYASHQRASLFYSDSDRLPGCSFSDDNSDDCDIEVSYNGVRNTFQPISREGVPPPGPGYTTDCSLHAASEPEPYSSNAGKMNVQSGTHRFYSDTEGLLDNQKESIYHTPPSPAPGDYSGTRDPQKSSLLLQQKGCSTTDSSKD